MYERVWDVHYRFPRVFCRLCPPEGFKWTYLLFINDTKGTTDIRGKIPATACKSLSALTSIESFIDNKFQ